MIIAAAKPYLRMWILLCSDCALRSGTAARIGNEHYDPTARTISVTSKYGSVVTLPVTEEIAALAASCREPNMPWMSQLERGEKVNGRAGAVIKLGPSRKPYSQAGLCIAWGKLLRHCGIARRLVPHDLRRTTARRVYSATHDLRLVQALLGHSHLAHTAWYLQDALTVVPASTLELAKLNPTTEAIQ